MKKVHAFGSPKNLRQFNLARARVGFNGKENDNDVKGDGNSQDYGMRIYDPRLAKFFSIDPITRGYPELTPYQFASNTPIQAIDLDGAEAQKVNEDVNTLVIVIQGWEGFDPLPNRTQFENNKARGAKSDAGDFNTLNELNSTKLQVVQFSSSDNDLTTKIDVAVTIKEYKKSNPHGKVVLVGHSLGADNAIELVNENPDINIDYLITVDISDGTHPDANTIPGNVKNAINFHGTAPGSIGGEKIKKASGNKSSNIANIPVQGVEHEKMDSEKAPTIKAWIKNIGKASDSENEKKK